MEFFIKMWALIVCALISCRPEHAGEGSHEIVGRLTEMLAESGGRLLVFSFLHHLPRQFLEFLDVFKRHCRHLMRQCVDVCLYFHERGGFGVIVVIKRGRDWWSWRRIFFNINIRDHLHDRLSRWGLPTVYLAVEQLQIQYTLQYTRSYNRHSVHLVCHDHKVAVFARRLPTTRERERTSALQETLTMSATHRPTASEYWLINGELIH